ncbi:MAG: DUF1906 domain-containing protein [Cohnella sp.]|nr:DUF1906 domain-containing protein [Cohnella sp.]
MAIKGIDCAQPIPAATAKAIAAQGYRFAARYLVPAGYAWKRLTRKEAEGITAAGMTIVSVFETTANRPAGGADSGRADGQAALKEASAIGQPEGTAIYFAVDYDAQPKDYDEIEAYLRAATKELGQYRTGIYGSYAVIEEMRRRGAAQHFWQTYAWSRGQKSAYANVWQHKNGVTVAGHPVDLNESYGNEGWWDTESVKPDGSPGSEGSSGSNGSTGSSGSGGEDTYMISHEDAEKIIRFLSAAWYATEDPQAQAEFNRLANEVRKAAGLPLQS